MSSQEPSLAILRSGPDDRAALERLAALDSATHPVGRRANRRSEPRAPSRDRTATGAAIADPFRPTAQLVELLAVRANSCGGAWSRVAGWGPTREPSPCVRRSRRDKPAGRVQGTGFSKGEAHVDQ